MLNWVSFFFADRNLPDAWKLRKRDLVPAGAFYHTMSGYISCRIVTSKKFVCLCLGCLVATHKGSGTHICRSWLPACQLLLTILSCSRQESAAMTTPQQNNSNSTPKPATSVLPVQLPSGPAAQQTSVTTSKPKIIGLYGISGCGKTTL